MNYQAKNLKVKDIIKIISFRKIQIRDTNFYSDSISR